MLEIYTDRIPSQVKLKTRKDIMDMIMNLEGLDYKQFKNPDNIVKAIGELRHLAYLKDIHDVWP